MKHTPGPWQVTFKNGRTVGRIECHHEKMQIERFGIAQCLRPPYSEEEFQANAHLIAAAPDLLEALKGLLAYATPYSGVTYSDPRVEAARAAIARATAGPEPKEEDARDIEQESLKGGKE